MPQTIDKTNQGQIIGGTFSNRENADKAVKAFVEAGVPATNIQMVVQLSDEPKTAYTDVLSDRGFAESQAAYYDRAIRDGKILVAVSDVVEPAPIVDIFDKYGAEYNPDGNRNVRHDVGGMTAGAVVGAVAGGVVGTVVAGPLGGAAGAAAGAVVGGGTGAAAGKAIEHNK
jgi:hypothetical protein